jgi:hypothetical protein
MASGTAIGGTGGYALISSTKVSTKRESIFKLYVSISTKKIARYFGVIAALAYLESERYTMHIWLAMTLITLLAALCALFFVAL